MFSRERQRMLPSGFFLPSFLVLHRISGARKCLLSVADTLAAVANKISAKAPLLLQEQEVGFSQRSLPFLIL
jgi:hypothetical protein